MQSNPNLDLLAGYPVVLDWAVAWGDMDAFQHVNNVVYFRYFENARLEYFRRLGWGTVRPESGVGPIVASMQARFRKALTYPDTIAIGARVSSLGEDRFTIEHAIVSGRLGAVTTEGQGVIVLYDYAQGKKAPIPEDLRRRILEMEGRPLPSTNPIP
jgi:acyl-CoA thioester hydrolase